MNNKVWKNWRFFPQSSVLFSSSLCRAERTLFLFHSNSPPSFPGTSPAHRNPSSGWQRWWWEARSRVTRPPATSSCEAHWKKKTLSTMKWLRSSVAATISLLPLLSLRHEQDFLFHSLVGLSCGADVHHSGAPQVAPCQPLHSWRHGCGEHDSLQDSIKELKKTFRANTWDQQCIRDSRTCLYLCFPDSKFIIIFSGSSASSVSGFWLVTGMYSRIFWTSGSKPMSIIRSASSRTTYVQRPRTR